MATPSSTRRRLLAGAALVVVAIVAVPLAAAAVLWLRAGTSNVGTLDFARELRIPPLLDGRPDGSGRTLFELEARAGTSELRAGERTPTWGFNGAHLGPTLRASRGDRIALRVVNRLPQATTVHWHGMHLPARADGGPHQPIEPGATWTPSWTVDQPAATLWYHPHLHGTTEEHVYRGLAGMFIIDDPTAARPGLPAEYGVDDIPLIVQDARFEDGGALSFAQGRVSPIGRLGDAILVNGTANPHLDVTTTRVRLRLLNASTARIYAFGFDDDRGFDLVATDGGLLAAAERLRRIQLSPGERAEIVVRLAARERVVLRSFAPDLGGVDAFNARFAGGRDSFDILELRAGGELRRSAPVPATLAEPVAPAGAERARVRRFELGSRSINDRRLDMSRIDEVVPIDTTEVWEVTNRAGMPHNFHVHDAQFAVLEHDGKRPPPALGGPKDTIPVMPGDTIRVAIRFSDYADPAAPYMFHCHLLQHEDRGMMGQFSVVRPRAMSSATLSGPTDDRSTQPRRRGRHRDHRHST